MACVVCKTFQILAKNGVLTISLMVFTSLDVCLWSRTYDGDLHSSQCCDLLVTWLFDPQHFLSMLFTSSPFSDVNCDDVFGSPSSSIGSFFLLH